MKKVLFLLILVNVLLLVAYCWQEQNKGRLNTSGIITSMNKKASIMHHIQDKKRLLMLQNPSVRRYVGDDVLDAWSDLQSVITCFEEDVSLIMEQLEDGKSLSKKETKLLYEKANCVLADITLIGNDIFGDKRIQKLRHFSDKEVQHTLDNIANLSEEYSIEIDSCLFLIENETHPYLIFTLLNNLLFDFENTLFERIEYIGAWYYPDRTSIYSFFKQEKWHYKKGDKAKLNFSFGRFDQRGHKPRYELSFVKVNGQYFKSKKRKYYYGNIEVALLPKQLGYNDVVVEAHIIDRVLDTVIIDTSHYQYFVYP